MKKIDNEVDKHFLKSAGKIDSFKLLTQNLISNIWQKNIKKTEQELWIDDNLFRQIEQQDLLLYYCLRDYGFKFENIQKLFEKKKKD